MDKVVEIASDASISALYVAVELVLSVKDFKLWKVIDPSFLSDMNHPDTSPAQPLVQDFRASDGKLGGRAL